MHAARGKTRPSLMRGRNKNKTKLLSTASLALEPAALRGAGVASGQHAARRHAFDYRKTKADTAQPGKGRGGVGSVRREPNLVESSNNRRGVRDSRGLQQDAVEGVTPVEEAHEGLHEVSSHRTAHASVVHGHDVLRLRMHRAAKQKKGTTVQVVDTREEQQTPPGGNNGGTAVRTHPSE